MTDLTRMSEPADRVIATSTDVSEGGGRRRIEIVTPDRPDPRVRNWHVRLFGPGDAVPAEAYLASSLTGALAVADCLARGQDVARDYYLIEDAADAPR